MKTPIESFEVYVGLAGGSDQAAARLGMTVGMVNHIRRGIRGISPAVAMAIESDSSGEVTRAMLRPDLWGDIKAA